ncbi:ArsR/SmtB family transcription factor [Chamaesiphon polymorphus]|uniref:ArsR/SmtB family transcription factor n=1 Tax=Chamaesiphon polymorphus TaxID=2107691 RepID=UPI001C63880F|nr:metalloregulator ArsR/SmtB family transcription factor [Chamaesiphon polymorphus]
MLDQNAVATFLTAIGDPIRLQILFVLRGARLNVGEVAAQFKLSRPAISHHLKVLKDAGIVKSEKVGQEVFYWVDKPYIVGELRTLADIPESYIKSDDR